MRILRFIHIWPLFMVKVSDFELNTQIQKAFFASFPSKDILSNIAIS